MYDYVIVGAGSAGCVLANRLSADPAVRVLLLEAGGPDTSPFIHTPAMMGFLPDGPHDWRYRTVPQAYCNLRRFPWPRGRTLGGSSSINYMIYIRGHATDYDRWAEAGNKGWSYEDVLPVFRKSEHNERLEDRYHGRGGPLNVADHRFRHPLSEMFVASAREAGVPANADFNGPVQDGAGFYQVTQKDGLRWSTASAFLRPALARPNLTVITGALACRIRFAGRRATGVEYVRHGQSALADAAREIVLCGGSVNSPQLLLLSGVGPADHLRAVGVDVVADLPGVGKNLQDHLGTFVRNEITVPFSLYGATPEQLAQVQAEYEATRQGLFTSNIAEAGAFLRTGGADGPPNLQGPDHAGLRRSPRSAAHRSGLSERPRRPAAVRGGDPDGPRHLAGEAARRHPRARAGPGCRGAQRSRDRDLRARPRLRHPLPPGRHLQDGHRRAGGGGRLPPRPRAGRAAGGGRLRHADPDRRQHQRADHHDRGEGGGDD